MKKTKTGLTRKRTKYPGLDKKVHPKVRQDYLDIDYADKLSDKEKEWLSNFNEEYVGASFTHKGKSLHRTKKARKDCYDRNNARNRDVFALAKANGRLEGINELTGEYNKAVDLNPNTVEDAVIEVIDFKKSLKE